MVAAIQRQANQLNGCSCETRDGVSVRVVYEPATGRVVTGFPDNDPIPNLKPVE